MHCFLISKTNVIFKANESCRRDVLHPHKTRLNKPITILFRMGQLFDWLNNTKAITECNEQKFDKKCTFYVQKSFLKGKKSF